MNTSRPSRRWFSSPCCTLNSSSPSMWCLHVVSSSVDLLEQERPWWLEPLPIRVRWYFIVLFVHSPRTVVPSPSSCEKEQTACPNGWEKLSDNFEHCLNKPNSTNPPSFSLMKLMVLLLFEAANKYSSLPLPHWLGPNPFLYCLYAACSDGWSRL